MANIWPASLPDYIMVDGFKESPPKNSIRTPTDVGPAKLRRRTTANVRPIAGKQLMKKTQVATLETFYNTTLSSGTQSFDWTSPRTGSAVSMRFVDEPVYESAGGTAYIVTMNLEILP